MVIEIKNKLKHLIKSDKAQKSCHKLLLTLNGSENVESTLNVKIQFMNFNEQMFCIRVNKTGGQLSDLLKHFKNFKRILEPILIQIE